MYSLEPVAVPNNHYDLVETGWNLAALEMKDSVAFHREVSRKDMTAEIARNVIATVNRDRKKDGRGHMLTDLAPVVVLILAALFTRWSGDPGNTQAFVEDVVTPFGVAGLGAWMLADNIRDRRQKKRHARTRAHFMKIFKREIDRGWPNPRVVGTVVTPMLI